MKKLLIGLAALAAVGASGHTVSAQAATEITLIHGIPGTTVDVVVDGTVVIDGFVPGSLADISSFAGKTLNNVEVRDDATGAVVIGPVATLDVPASGNFSYIAHLDASGTAVLTPFENNVNPTADAGQARLTLRHSAQAPAIDLVIGDQRPVVGATNGQSVELELAAGQLTDAQIALTGDVPIKQIATLDLAANTNTIVYVVGSAEADTLDFVVQVISFAVDAPATTTTVVGDTSMVPTAVNTGSPLGDSNTLLYAIIVGVGLVAGAGALAARRHV